MFLTELRSETKLKTFLRNLFFFNTILRGHFIKIYHLNLIFYPLLVVQNLAKVKLIFLLVNNTI